MSEARNAETLPATKAIQVEVATIKLVIPAPVYVATIKPEKKVIWVEVTTEERR